MTPTITLSLESLGPRTVRILFFEETVKDGSHILDIIEIDLPEDMAEDAAEMIVERLSEIAPNRAVTQIKAPWTADMSGAENLVEKLARLFQAHTHVQPGEAHLNVYEGDPGQKTTEIPF